MPYIITYQAPGMPEAVAVAGAVYDVGAAAGQARGMLIRACNVPGAVYRVKEVAAAGTESWQEREARRFLTGAYVPTPWHNEPFYAPRAGELYAHMSQKSPGLISFTESPEKGELDRQAQAMAPGRFLQRYFPEIGNDAIEAWAAKCDALAGNMVMRITSDADVIERVYVNGPTSCMSEDASDYEGPCHPARVYAGPDLAVAYLGDAGDATARAVVWPEMKIYTRIYGDISRMTLALEGAGYKLGLMNGARVQRIPADWDNTFVMPYVDSITSARDDGEYITLGSGPLDTCNTSGISGETGFRCESCGEHYHDDEHNTVSGDAWCDGCTESGASWCDYSDEFYADGGYYEVVTVHDHPHYNRISSQFLDRCDCYEVDGEYYYCDSVTSCEDCSETILNDDAHYSNHDDCTRCGCCHDQHQRDNAPDDDEESDDCGGAAVIDIAPYCPHPDQVEMSL